MKKVLLAVLAVATMFVSCKKDPVLVGSITLNQTTASVVEGETLKLTATVAPDNAENKEVEWKSDNTAVATVNAGTVTGVKAGTAKITVAATDGSGVKATCTVSVVTKTIPVTKIDLSYTEYSLKKDETLTLTAQITPADATVQAVTWASDNVSVATVDSKGVVTAKGAGKAKITAKATDDSKVVSTPCVITVLEPRTMFMKFKTALMRVGGKVMTQNVWYGSIDEYAQRDDCDDAQWSTANANIVSCEGSKFTAVAPGETTIKASDAAGNEVECAVKVLPPSDKSYDYNYGVAIDLCNDATGWSSGYHKVNGEKVFDQVVVDTENKVSGTGCIAVNGNTGYCWFTKKFDKAIDASKVTNPAIFLRFYISDPSKIDYDATGQLEICSSGTSDAEELTYTFAMFGANDPNSKFKLKSGWNNIVLPFDVANANSGFRANHIDFIRMYQNPSNIISGLDLKIDQIRVVDWTEFDTCDNFDMWYDGAIEANAFVYAFDEKDKKEGKGCVSVVDHIIDGPISNLRLKMWTGREYALPVNLDQSNSLLKFWLYVDDGEAFKKIHCVFEVSSELINDAHNYNWTIVPGTYDFKTGWNEITCDFAAAGGDTTPESKRDLRKINYFRAVFTPQGAPVKAYTYKIDNFRIVKK